MSEHAARYLESVAAFFEAHPESWIQHEYAIDKDGRRVLPDDPAACGWCLMGRLFVAPDSEARHSAMWALLSRMTEDETVSDWNDRPWRTVEQVIEELRAAAKWSRENVIPEREPCLQ